MQSKSNARWNNKQIEFFLFVRISLRAQCYAANMRIFLTHYNQRARSLRL